MEPDSAHRPGQATLRIPVDVACVELESECGGQPGAGRPETATVTELENWIDVQSESSSARLERMRYFVQALNFQPAREPPVGISTQLVRV